MAVWGHEPASFAHLPADYTLKVFERWGIPTINPAACRPDTRSFNWMAAIGAVKSGTVAAYRDDSGELESKPAGALGASWIAYAARMFRDFDPGPSGSSSCTCRGPRCCRSAPASSR